MSAQFALPAFGKPLRPAEYYETIQGILDVLRPYSTLRTIANHLNNQGLTTPSGRRWSKSAVTNFIRSRTNITN